MAVLPVNYKTVGDMLGKPIWSIIYSHNDLSITILQFLADNPGSDIEYYGYGSKWCRLKEEFGNNYNVVIDGGLYNCQNERITRFLPGTVLDNYGWDITKPENNRHYHVGFVDWTETKFNCNLDVDIVL
jgi:hypothetical protein